MSKSSGNKISKRRILCLVHAHGEGKTEAAFLRYINSLNRKKDTLVKITHSHGGGPTAIISEALRILDNVEYDDAMVVLDTDRKWPDTLVKRCHTKNIRVIGSKPSCIEGFFISMLEPRKKLNNMTSRAIKEYFHKNYLSASKKTVLQEYKKIFPPRTLSKFRKINRSLDQIMQMILETTKS